MDAIDRINVRLKKLLEYLDILKKYQGVTAMELRNSSEKRGVVERYLHLASEIVIDIANLLNAEYRFRPSDNYRETIEILGEERVLDKQFAKNLSKLAGFRNILVHDYIKIDYNKVADKVNNHLGDFEKFARSVANYIS